MKNNNSNSFRIVKFVFAYLILFIVLLLAVGCSSKEHMKQDVENAVRQWLWSNSNFDSISIQEISFPDGNDYCTATCIVSCTGKFFDVTETIGLEFAKNDNQWVVRGDPFYYGKRQFVFHQNYEDFYYFGDRNIVALFQIQEMNEEKIDVINYEYDSSGRGEYGTWDRSTEEWGVTYRENLQCFSFSYKNVGKSYRIYADHIEVGRQTSNLGTRYTEYSEVFPEDPNGYWWFRERWPNIVATKDEITSGTVIVPNIITGQSFSSAKNTLEEYGFIVVAVEEIEPYYVEGSVLRSEPTSGTEVPYGSTIILYVSAGNDLE